MKKVLKIAGISFSILMLLTVALVVGLFMFVDPNDFKPQISRAVQNSTGRELAIEGKIEWSIFPWLGFRLHNVTLSNVAPFDKAAFLTIEEANTHIRLLPLLSGNIELGKISLSGFQLHLERNAQGQENWIVPAKTSAEKNNVATTPAITAQAPATATPATSSSASPIKNISISNIDISNGLVSWKDAKTNQRASLSDIQFQSQHIQMGKPFPVAFKTSLASENPKLSAQVGLSSKVTVDLQNQSYQLSDVDFTAALQTASLKEKSLLFKNTAKIISLDGKTQTLLIPHLKTELGDMIIRSDINATSLNNNPNVKATIEIPTFDLQHSLDQLGKPMHFPEKAFNAVSLNMGVKASADQINVHTLQMKIDDSTVNGTVNVIDLDHPTVNFTLNLDKIDLSRYMPQTAKSTEQSPAASPTPAATNNAPAQSATPANNTPINISALQQFNANGQVQMGIVKYDTLAASNFSAKISAREGVIVIAPITTSIAGGTYSGNIRIEAQNSGMTINTVQKLDNLQAADLVKFIQAESKASLKSLDLTGVGNLALALNTSGASTAALKQNLNGTVNVELQNGVLHGIDLNHLMKTAGAVVNREATPSQVGPNQTSFGDIKGSLAINQGIATITQMLVQSPAFTATVTGSMDLVKETLNLSLRLQAVSTDDSNAGQFKTHGIAIPVSITGSFDNPKISLDMQKLLQEAVEHQKESAVKKVRENIQNKINDKAQDLLNRLKL